MRIVMCHFKERLLNGGAEVGVWTGKGRELLRWRIAPNEELHKLYCVPYIVIITSSSSK